MSRPGDRLERRYAWLLTLYPRAHRLVYQEEMLTVLMAGARPGQRYPSLADTLDLLRSAARLRLGRVSAGITDGRWRDAAAIVGVLAPMLLLAREARPILGAQLWSIRLGPDSLNLPAAGWLPASAWAIVAVLALSGWRRSAALLASITLAGQAIVLGQRYPESPVFVLHSLWPLVLAVAATAALTVPVQTRRALTILGWHKTALFAAASVLLGVSAALDPLTARIARNGTEMSVSLWGGGGGYLPGLLPDSAGGATGALALVACAASAVAMLAVIARVDSGIRRRVVALLAPAAAAMFVSSSLFFNGFDVSSPRFMPPVLLAPEQWAVLSITPIAALVLGAFLVHRRDRHRYLIELGEQTERRQLKPPPG